MIAGWVDRPGDRRKPLFCAEFAALFGYSPVSHHIYKDVIPGRRVIMRNDADTRRIESFSDGVFAIAVTLLILEIKIPGQQVVNEHGLALSLIGIWPSYLAFITSFVTILVIWAHHHWIFSLIARADHLLIYLNGLLLLVVTFVPFPTGLLAEYLLHPQARVAAGFYTDTFFLISLSFDILWRHVSKDNRLLSPGDNAKYTTSSAQISGHYRFGPLFYLGAFAVSFWSEILGVAACLLLALFFAVDAWPLQSDGSTQPRSDSIGQRD